MSRLLMITLMITLGSCQYSRNDSCDAYKGALSSQGDSFGPYSQPNRQKYYSQAPDGLSMGKCNSIPCIGSPVFLVEKAHEYINQQFDRDNKYSSVKYLCYHKNTTKAPANSVLYRFIFELSNYGGAKYVGVEVDSSNAGMASAQYNRFILHRDLEVVKKTLGVPGLVCRPTLTCGDQKLLYSFYNRDSSSQVGGDYAGKNMNTVSDYILNQIAKENTPSNRKVCKNENYKRVYNRKLRNYFRDETQAVTPPIRENFYCNPKAMSISRIRLACRTNGIWNADNLEAFQLIRRDTVDGNLAPGPVQGNTGVSDRYFKDISIEGASEVQFEFWGADNQRREFNPSTNEIRIVTYDDRNKIIDEIRCGEYFDHNLIKSERMQAKDFLGFWYNYNGRNNIQRLGLIKYDRN